MAALPSSQEAVHQLWESEQLTLAARVEAHDPPSFNLEGLRLVGGLDTSFFAAGDGEGESGRSVAALAVLSLPDLRLVHTQLLALEALPAPYRAGFLGFREVPAYLELLRRAAAAGVRPQLLLVDGFGVLHPRCCGAASHLGVLASTPTVGVAKRLLRLEGLPPERQVRATAAAAVAAAGQGQAQQPASDSGWRPLVPPTLGRSPALWLQLATSTNREVLGAALCCPGGGGRGQPAFTRPIYVSVGHRLSLASALAVVQRCCRHRVPEPIRQADLLSRAEVRRVQQQEQRGQAAEEQPA